MYNIPCSHPFDYNCSSISLFSHTDLPANNTMFDLIILFTLFIGLVVILALVNYFQRWKSNPLVGKKLLNEWLEAHKLELPDASSIFSVLNRRLQEIESDVSDLGSHLGSVSVGEDTPS